MGSGTGRYRRNGRACVMERHRKEDIGVIVECAGWGCGTGWCRRNGRGCTPCTHKGRKEVSRVMGECMERHGVVKCVGGAELCCAGEKGKRISRSDGKMKWYYGFFWWDGVVLSNRVNWDVYV